MAASARSTMAEPAGSAPDLHAGVPFVDHLGFEVVEVAVGRCTLGATVRPELTNRWGVAHGGMLMTLLDVAMARAARSPIAPEGPLQHGVVTVEMKTSFMRPGAGELRAHGRRLHQTATLAFCEAEVRDVSGRLVAHATGTFKYQRALPVGTRVRRTDDTTD